MSQLLHFFQKIDLNLDLHVVLEYYSCRSRSSRAALDQLCTLG